MCKNTIKVKFQPWRILTVLAMGLTASCPLRAAPKPAIVPPADTWQMDILIHGDPQRIVVQFPGFDQPKVFWYLPYTISNNTGRDVDFYPDFEIFTDTFKLYKAGRGVRKAVFNAIRQRYNDTIPLLEPEELITGRILRGEDNARDSVIIFEDIDPNATSVKIFASGLSNESTTIESPIYKNPATGKGKGILLKKTLMLQYQMPGDAYSPDQKVMLYRSRQWIMR
jgi:hypothetical protein